MLWAELRQRLRHQFSSLVLAHDVGKLLTALARAGTMESRQGVLPQDLAFGYKVTVRDLRGTLHASWFSWNDQWDLASFPCPHICEIAAAGRVIGGNAISQCASTRHLKALVRKGGL